MYSFTLETSSIKCIRKGGKSAEIDSFVACYMDVRKRGGSKGYTFATHKMCAELGHIQTRRFFFKNNYAKNFLCLFYLLSASET